VQFVSFKGAGRRSASAVMITQMLIGSSGGSANTALPPNYFLRLVEVLHVQLPFRKG